MQRAQRDRRVRWYVTNSLLIASQLIGVTGLAVLSLMSMHWLEAQKLAMPFLRSSGLYSACLSKSTAASTTRASAESIGSFARAIRQSFQRSCAIYESGSDEEIDTISASGVFANVYGSDLRRAVAATMSLLVAFVWLSCIKAASLSLCTAHGGANACAMCDSSSFAHKRSLLKIAKQVGHTEVLCGVTAVLVFLVCLKQTMQQNAPAYAEGATQLRNLLSSGFYMQCIATAMSGVTTILTNVIAAAYIEDAGIPIAHA